MKEYKEHAATEMNASVDSNFDASASLSKQDKSMYLEISVDEKWLAQKHKLVTTETLTKAIVPDLPFENVDGAPLRIDTDYLGKKRNVTNPCPGPFECKDSGKQKIEVW